MRYAQADYTVFDERYACTVYAHIIDPKRFVLVCAKTAIPERIAPHKWRLIAHGIQPPDRAKPWLKRNRFYEIFFYNS